MNNCHNCNEPLSNNHCAKEFKNSGEVDLSGCTLSTGNEIEFNFNNKRSNMETLQKAWYWASGKKTIIGLLGLQFLDVLEDGGVSIPKLAGTIATWFFSLLAGGGFGHKLVKTVRNK